MPEKSNRALRACAEWLAYCLKIGWAPADVPRLEQIWWNFHDDNGRMKEPEVTTTHP